MEEQKEPSPMEQLFGTFYGHVVEVKKHRLLVMFNGPDGSTYGITLKRKKLNDMQKQILKVDLPARVDFKERKVAFMGSDSKWY